MKQKKNNANRWKKVMALLLSASMLAPAAPCAVYASENPNDGQTLEDRAFDAAEAEEPGDPGNSENESANENEGDEGNEGSEHVHSWQYLKVSGNDQEITASGCQASGCSLSECQVRLTMRVDQDTERRVLVSANGEELAHDNMWNIPYEIRFYKVSPENGDLQEAGTEEDCPRDLGEYEVRAIFAGQKELYLKADYIIEAAHEHQWNYEGIPAGGRADGRIVCSGNADGAVCPLSMNMLLKTEPENEGKVTLLANNQELLHSSEWKIPYEIKYYAQSGDEAGTEENPPTDPGEYKVRAIFTDAPERYLEADYAVAAVHKHIWKYEQKGANAVKAVCQGEGVCDEGTEGIELTLTVTKESAYVSSPKTNRARLFAKCQNGVLTPDALEKLGISAKFTYYRDKKGKPGSLIGAREPQNAGKYHVQLTVGEQKSVVLKSAFTISKAERKGIEVAMGNYDLKQKSIPQPGLNQKLETAAKPVYYYVNAKKKDKKAWKSQKPKKAGSYYMFVSIGETANYKKYQTPKKEWKKFTVYSDHKWKGILPKELTAEEQPVRLSCGYCKEIRSVTLPKKTISVDLGKSQSLVSKGTGCAFTAKKEDYFTLSSKGKIKIKNDPASYKSMKKKIPVTVKVCGEIYTMNVKLEIPAPDIKITTKKVTHGNVWGYRFKFKYGLPEADDITVQMLEGSTDEIEKELKRYISSSYSTGNSYIDFSNPFLKKELGYKVQFKITANYGRNKSKPTIIKLIGTENGKNKYKWTQEREN